MRQFVAPAEALAAPVLVMLRLGRKEADSQESADAQRAEGERSAGMPERERIASAKVRQG
jgi:hypothetical protein